MKPKTQPVAQPGQTGRERNDHSRTPSEPMSGSKQVKNRNHSRHNNGEG
ncbi:small acid-soluble spore protein P [Cohnella caldifontis]|nr:small acid-soluble spore protein P [Cohnella sp. YIM B05605]